MIYILFSCSRILANFPKLPCIHLTCLALRVYTKHLNGQGLTPSQGFGQKHVLTLEGFPRGSRIERMRVLSSLGLWNT